MTTEGEGRGVSDEDIAMAAKSNLTVDRRGGSQNTGSERARLRRAMSVFGIGPAKDDQTA